MNLNKCYIINNISIAFISSLLTILLFIFCYEIIENIKYNSWKSKFDNNGWLGKITIPSPNKKLMWEYKPYGKTTWYDFNRYGFRDFDYPNIDKNKSEYRIAFIGDSVTLGFNVKNDNTFVRIFNRDINLLTIGNNIESLNFGVDSYDTLQIEELLKSKAINFNPNIVVYSLCLNDFDLTGEDEATGEKGKYFNKPNSFMIVKLIRAYRFIFKIDYHEYYFERNKVIIFDSINRMANLLRRNEINFYVAILPTFYIGHNDFIIYPLEHINNEISNKLNEYNIMTIDLYPYFKKTNLPQNIFALDLWHPSPKGHELIANALVAELKNKILNDYNHANRKNNCNYPAQKKSHK